MKKIETLAIVLIILWVITVIGNPLLTPAMTRLLDVEEFSALSSAEKVMLTARQVLRMLIQLGVAVWLFVQARRDRAAPWVWLLFGLTFGISAAILYLLTHLVQTVRDKDVPETFA